MFGVLFFCATSKQDTDPCLHFASRTCDSSPQFFNSWFVFFPSGYLVNLGTSLSTLSASYYPPSPFVSARCGSWSKSDQPFFRKFRSTRCLNMLTAYYAKPMQYGPIYLCITCPIMYNFCTSYQTQFCFSINQTCATDVLDSRVE